MHEYLARLYVLCFTVYTSLLAFEVCPLADLSHTHPLTLTLNLIWLVPQDHGSRIEWVGAAVLHSLLSHTHRLLRLHTQHGESEMHLWILWVGVQCL